MLNKNDILKKEQKILNFFFNTEFNMPDLPEWITDELIQYWNENIFYIHYIPKISLDENLNLLLWQNKPSKIFYKKINEGKLKKEAKILTGKWVLIDGRDKPIKKVSWIRSNDLWILQKIGFNPKNYFKKWNKQLHQHEYLTNILKEKNFGSRFCLTIREINDLKPFVLNFLKIEPQKIIRLPFFIEYNYFGNAIYKQWKTTETWEWFEDKFDDSQYLAGGSNSVGCIGWEPPEFWSTILTFRFVVEL
ncbi:MAG: hypothetical protein ABH808_00955 [Candidatus Kuenenbacteria bacterium]